MKIFAKKLSKIAPARKSFLRIFLNENFFTFEVPFKNLFAPTSGNRMSKIFRDLESLGKLMERIGLRCEHFLSQKRFKIEVAKKVFFYGFFPLCSLHLNVLLPPLPEIQCPNFLDFLNPWGKLMKRSGLRVEYFCS